MLTMTDQAMSAVRSITAQAGAPENGGLRIATDPARGALTLAVTPAPGADDQIIDDAGVRLFLDPEAATMLEDMSLDATVDGQGRVEFRVADQPG